jgi:hypothetical protein
VKSPPKDPDAEPKKRGRPKKIVTEEPPAILTEPKKRGRPRKIVLEEQIS